VAPALHESRTMRALALLLVATAACTAAEPDEMVSFPPDQSGEDQPPAQAACASEQGRKIFDATRDLIGMGSVPASLYSTQLNAADPAALIDGPQIFPAFRELIASAEHHVSLQTYVWEADTDPTNEIVAGLRDLAARRAAEAPDAPPVTVRFLFDVSTLGFGSTVTALPKAWAQVEALALDPKRVTFELAGYYHLAMGNLHVKTLVVDGRAAIITGANPQAHHNYAQPWRDAGYKLSGDVAVALLADFDNAWQQSKLWTCGSVENPEFLECQADPQPVTYAIIHADLPADTCKPMLVASRQSDMNPTSNRTDNTQDQAFIAAFGAATSHIRMQTPNLNDDAAKAALVDAVKRGVRVELVLSKGFNDMSEIGPGQGGTNDTNVAALHATLEAAGVTDICKKLQIRWYSRDGLHAVEGNGVYASHAKYASVDDTVVIVGTANMDTQSWNNSREVNVVVDDAVTTRAWDEALFLPDFDSGLLVDQCPSL
jgi:phosphatidylserine/phosphatidylglycerophosphate/cardiolipin synthase-like enzyme